MVTLGSLWLAALISGVGVWIMQFIVWVALPHHKSDYKVLPDEDEARRSLTPQNLAPGQYNIPHILTRADLSKPAVRSKFEEGPVCFLTVLPRGVPPMGKSLLLTLVFGVGVSLVVAVFAGRTLPATAAFLDVFTVTGAIAWLAYGVAVIPDAIWFGRPWGAIGKQLLDALLFALVTGAVFGWRWP